MVDIATDVDEFGGVLVQDDVDEFGGILVPEEEEDTNFLQDLYGAGEVAATIGTGVVGDIVGGVAGTATALGLQDIETGVNVLDSVRDAITTQPQTVAGKRMLQSVGDIEILKTIADVTQSAEQKLADAGFETEAGPLRTALAVAFPTAIGELLGAKLPGAATKLTKRAGEKAAEKTAERSSELAEEAAEVGKKDLSSEEALTESVAAIESPSDAEKIINIAPDPEFYKAADELGLSTEPLASYASKNPQFRSLEQSLAAMPASILDTQGKKFVSELSQRADKIIEQYGGTLDKAELSDRFKTESLKTVDDLAQQADDIYEGLNKTIPKKTKVNASNTLDFIKNKADELGGYDELPPLLKKLQRSLKPKKTSKKVETVSPVFGTKIKTETSSTYPTHERLNTFRKEVGQALNKRSGPFKDAPTGDLKQIYRVLKEDQNSVAKNAGVLDVSKSADALIIQRKQIEDNMSSLLGKELTGSLLPKVGRSLKQLSKGEVDQFGALLSKIPKNLRQEVVVSSLNDIFKGTGVDKQGLDVTRFSKFMDELERSPTIKKKLYKELPPESIKTLDNLYKVSKGVSTALQDKIPTGRVMSLFEDKNGLLSKVLGHAAGTIASTKGGPLVGDAVREILSQKSSRSQAASDLLGSPRFQEMIKQAVKDGVTEGNQKSDKLIKAEDLMKKSKKYKKWADSLSESQKAQIASVGLTSYLLNPEESEP